MQSTATFATAILRGDVLQLYSSILILGTDHSAMVLCGNTVLIASAPHKGFSRS